MQTLGAAAVYCTGAERRLVGVVDAGCHGDPLTIDANSPLSSVYDSSGSESPHSASMDHQTGVYDTRCDMLGQRWADMSLLNLLHTTNNYKLEIHTPV